MKHARTIITIIVAQAVAVGIAAPILRRSDPIRGRHIVIHLSELARVTRVDDNSGFRIVGIEGLQIITATGGALRAMTNGNTQ